jgi:hypothetical protein
MNNDRARYFVREAERMAKTALEAKAIQSKYFSKPPDNKVPDDVLVVTAAFDTQDNGFYHVFTGWGANGVCRVLRFGFTECSIDLDEAEQYDSIWEILNAKVFSEPLITQNGKRLSISRGFWDRGGHRSRAVTHICDKLLAFDPYIGSPRDDPRHELIWDTGNGYYYGKSEQLSDSMGAKMKMKNFHLPNDCMGDFISQISRQYRRNEEDKFGNKKSVWVHGGDDHYRDCLNMNYAAMLDLGLDEKLFDTDFLNKRKAVVEQEKELDNRIEKAKDEQRERNQQQPPRAVRRNTSSYFGRGRF